MNYLKKVVTVVFCACFLLTLRAQQHPNIMITRAGADSLRKGCEVYPLLKKTYQEVKAEADRAMSAPINIPVPKDGGGGFTHEQHKRNYQNVMACGIAYQITRDKKYAEYVKEMLLGYAARYETWPLKHPKSKPSNESGRIFWQILNDCVWQVYMAQGYDLVYEAISPGERQLIENKLFIPVVKFITVQGSETFNRIHNHGTWAVAAVGLTGYVIKRPDFVEMALKGADKKGKSGYLAQLDQLFSPDGYYTEGPYYQRYALLPFVIFARAIHQYQPALHIYDYRNHILEKAINTALQCTYTNGAFFPVNDAIKDKTFESDELVYGVNLAYADMGGGADLLDVAQRQGKVIISDAGLKVAKDVAAGISKPFNYRSLWIDDGADGTNGGLGILRSGEGESQQCLVFKAASQGMGHGHFDRLNLLYYDDGAEVFSDYGAARFINIESKSDGEYLPENKTWAKQTVAHNTLVVDQTSHFRASLDEAQKYHPERLFFQADGTVQAVSAREDKAFPGVTMVRTSGLLHIPGLPKALMMDVCVAGSADKHQYDLPFWYNGYLTDASFKFQVFADQLKPAGTAFGYQHLWLTAVGSPEAGDGYITVMNNHRFYTTYFATGSPLQVKLVSLGANDPHLNLFDGKAFILSQPQASFQTFVSLTESHGKVNPVAETTTGAKSALSALRIINSDKEHTEFSFMVKDKTYRVLITYKGTDQNFIQLLK